MRIGLIGAILIATLPLARAQVSTPPSDKFWLAGRYDGNRVIVYFDAVKFGAPIPTDIARPIADPVATGFCAPVALPQSYLASFENAQGAEHFALGDEYDLLLPQGMTATIRLTTLVGFENDEDAGNDSYIGALGTIEGDSYILSGQNYYVVRHHQQAKPEKPQVQIQKYLAAAELVSRLRKKSDLCDRMRERCV